MLIRTTWRRHRGAWPAEPPLLSPEERERIDAGPWFRGLSRTVRHDLLRLAVLRRLEDGEAVPSAADSPTLVGVARGALRLRVRLSSGRPLALTYLSPGSWVGEIAIDGDSSRAQELHARGGTTVLQIPTHALQHLLICHADLHKQLLQLQTHRLRHLETLLHDMRTLRLPGRLAKALAGLSRDFGEAAEEGGRRIVLNLTQKDLADLAGGSRQHTNLALQGLQRIGAIAADSRGVRVLATTLSTTGDHE